MPIPSSIIRFGNAPLTKPDSGVCYSRTFSSPAEQKAWFTARLTNIKEGNTEIRPYSGRYGAPWNSDDIITSDYMMFTNDGAKWYYAFIDRVVYVNEQRCDIYFTIDDLQTWYFDYTLRPVYVEREHAADDSIGANILDEPISTGELRYLEYDVDDKLKTWGVIAETTEGLEKNPTVFDKKEPAPGGKVNGQQSGCGRYYWPSTDYEKCVEWLDKMNKAGGGSSIQAMYMFPDAFLEAYKTHSGENIFEAIPGIDDLSLPARPYKPDINPIGPLDGYTPRNNKLYTYPFNFLRILNMVGGYHDYRFEFFNKELQFMLKGAMDINGDLILVPMFYNSDLGANDAEFINLGGLPAVSWAYNYYQNWSAQNSASNMLGLLGGTAMVLGGTALFGAATGGLGGAAFAGMSASAVEGAALSGASMAVGGLNTVAGANANFIDASNAPDKALGATSHSTSFQTLPNHFRVFRMGVRRQFAERIDQFFDVYGYTTQRVKTPDRSSRPHVNYCKTRDAQFQGTVPADAMDRINRVWNQGIWWFHDDNIGDFSIANK